MYMQGCQNLKIKKKEKKRNKLCKDTFFIFFLFFGNYARDNFWHNFVSQLAMWRVVIGNGVSSYGPLTYSYKLQLIMWRVMT